MPEYRVPEKFQMIPHIVEILPSIFYGQTAVLDIDGDGRDEYVFGERYRDVFWMDYEPETGKWTRYLLGSGSSSDVGLAAVDVDGDGYVDFVTGGVWFRNSRDLRNTPCERFVFDKELWHVHDVMAGDIDGDGKPEIITMSDQSNLRYYKIPDDPTQPWERHDIAPPVHSGVCIGDIDGDGDLDIVRTDVWFENVNGDASEWKEHYIGHFGAESGWQENGAMTWICDMDGDGDNDIVVVEAEINGARLFWMENVKGDGTEWVRHEIKQEDDRQRAPLHSLFVGDLDGDGDFDIFTCEAEDTEQPEWERPRWFIYENLDGKGGAWKEHVIFDGNLGGHLAMFGNFDGDGDLDLLSKPWIPRAQNAAAGRNYVIFLENIAGEGKETDLSQLT